MVLLTHILGAHGHAARGLPDVQDMNTSCAWQQQVAQVATPTEYILSIMFRGYSIYIYVKENEIKA